MKTNGMHQPTSVLHTENIAIVPLVQPRVSAGRSELDVADIVATVSWGNKSNFPNRLRAAHPHQRDDH